MNRFFPPILPLSILAFLAIAGCDRVTDFVPHAPFPVKVFSSDGSPIKGAYIVSERWKVTDDLIGRPYQVHGWTDSTGTVILEKEAYGERAWIAVGDHFIENVERLTDSSYYLDPTPERLRRLGDVEGEAVYFRDGLLATVVYQGSYHAYSYTDTSVTELMSLGFPNAPKVFRVLGDTLWFTQHSDHVYAYDISDPTNPNMIYDLLVPGYLREFALHGNLLITADPTGDFTQHGPLQIWRVEPIGSVEPLSHIDNILVRCLEIVRGFLVVIGHVDGEGWAALTYDISDPSAPGEVSKRSIPEQGDPRGSYEFEILGSYGLVKWGRWDFELYDDAAYYRYIDLSDPLHPFLSNPRQLDMYIHRMIRPDLMLGKIQLGPSDETEFSTLQRGSLEGGFEITAQANARSWWIEEGAAPPYFLIGGALWKLEPGSL